MEISDSSTDAEPEGAAHHVQNAEKPVEFTFDKKEKPIMNEEYELWVNNNNLLGTWLRGNMSEDVMNLVIGTETAFDMWHLLVEQLIQASNEWEKCPIKKKEEYLKKFKNQCDNLAALINQIQIQTKLFNLVLV